jgi:hypothetical protein
MPIVKVDNSSFVRDTSSMAIMNTDEAARSDYKMKAKLLQTQKQEINKVKSEIENIKNDVSEIKNLMLKLLDKGSNV